MVAWTTFLKAASFADETNKVSLDALFKRGPNWQLKTNGLMMIKYFGCE